MVPLGPVAWLGWYALAAIGLGVGVVKGVEYIIPPFLKGKPKKR